MTTTYLENIDYRSIGIELNIPLMYVYAYHGNQNLCYKYPIRNLTEEEIAFAEYCEELQSYDIEDLILFGEENGVSEKEVRADYLILAQKQFPKVAYPLLRKYWDILIKPYLNYGNSVAMVMEPLTKQNVHMLLSNIAMGIPANEAERIEVSDRLRALQLLLGQMNAEEERSLTQTTNDADVIDLTEDLDSTKLKLLIDKLTATKVKQTKKIKSK